MKVLMKEILILEPNSPVFPWGAFIIWNYTYTWRGCLSLGRSS